MTRLCPDRCYIGTALYYDFFLLFYYVRYCVKTVNEPARKILTLITLTRNLLIHVVSQELLMLAYTEV